MEAIREGFLSVIPVPVLKLNTWQEVERRICGIPTVSFEDLKASSKRCYFEYIYSFNKI